ncbi:MAG: glycosyltransferase family 2 protein, partial [Gammaproteobacteria bacterium]|nr:glycosyltransferase family 2 protein [Gammaproteobacteria bacterium]
MKLGIVVPCYNEEAVIQETVHRLLSLLTRLVDAQLVDGSSKIWFVDDGSKDKTWALIESFSKRDERVRGIKLSRNRGHQNALLAGLFTADGDALVSIDADLQDDVNVIESMVRENHSGAEIVYGVRQKRETDSWFKRVTAEGFYRLLATMGVETVFNHADYRLMSRRAIEALKEFREVNLFVRGVVPLIGYRSSVVYYDRAERFAGESKYPLRKMLALALDAITSFSVVPLRLITLMGFVVFVATLMITGWILWTRFFTDSAVPGWASTVLPMYMLGG